MPEIFRTSPVKATTNPTPLVIHCSDPRYQPHFQDFLRNALKLDRYAVIAVPGGAHFLTLADNQPQFSWVGWQWVKFVHSVARAERVVLFGHHDCRWYLEMSSTHDPAQLPARVAEDLRSVRGALLERFPRLRVETYFARFEGDIAVVDSV
jgi:hypothetical protein